MVNWLAHAREVLQLDGSSGPTTAAQGLGAVAADASDPLDASPRWVVELADGQRLEMIFCPDATREQALVALPGSVSAMPLRAQPDRRATPAERMELMRLIGMTLAGDPDGQREAVAVALADVDVALTCFRQLVAERGLAVVGREAGSER